MSSNKNKLQYLVRIFLFLTLCVSLGVSPTQAQGTEPPSADTIAVVEGLPTQQIIIKFKLNAADARAAIGTPAQMNRLSAKAKVDLTYFRPMADVLDAHVLSLPGKMPLATVERLAARLETLPEVEYAEPDYILQIVGDEISSENAPQAVTPTDPLYPNQWHLFAPVIGNVGINLPAAWEFTRGNPAIVTAVLDTGSLFGHPDLGGTFKPGYDMISLSTTGNDGNGRDADDSDPGNWVVANECGAGKPALNSNWHGTHVAGTIGAWNPTVGGTGIAPYSYLQTVRVLGKCGGNLSDIADGMLWAAGIPVTGVPTNASPARVMNLSLAGQFSCPTLYQNTIAAVRARNVVVVVAAGNENLDASGFSPAGCSGVITVAATDRNGNRASYSNFGSSIEIAAPGGSGGTGSADAVLSALNDGTTVPATHIYQYYNGTSMATPHVAGIVALMLSMNPSLTPDQVLTYLQTYRTGFPAGSTCNTSICGTGIANAAAVLSAINTTPYVYVVNSTADDSDGLCERAPGDCTLREAIITANGTAAADTIDFVVGGTITLAASLPTITKPLTIWGPSGQSLAIDGANLYRVLKVDTGVTLNLENLTIQNGKSVQGGGIYNNGTLNVLGVTFKGNTAINGGAIYEVTSSVTDISNSAFSGNSATSAGGGIESAGGVLKIINSTFSGNSAPSGAGLLSHTALYVGNTIIANSSGPDCTNLGALVSWDNNLIEGTGASACGIANGSNGSIIGVDPRLGALASNGGSTQTMALLSGSQAINAAYNGSCNAKDQTGKIRLPNGGATCDIGAYEVWDTTAPDTAINTKPPSQVNSATANFTFSGTDNFTQPADLTFQCYKDAGPNWTDCSSPLVLLNLSQGVHQLWVYAVDDVGNIDHPQTAYYSWTVDTVAPNVSLNSHPTDPSNSASADFTFSSTDATATFTCQLDGGGFSACTSPKNYPSLSNGSHTFSVMAVDPAGNLSTPAAYTWTVNVVTDTTPPDTTILTKPPVRTLNTSASFTFSGTDNVSLPANLTFECKLDGGTYAPCTSPQNYSGLTAVKHTFSVRAKDEAGNVDATPATYAWTVQKERARNRGFNTYVSTSKIPQFWVRNTAFAATDGKDTLVKKEGLASVKIIGAAGKTKTLTQTLTLSGVTGDRFTFSFWARGASIPTAGICRAQVLLYDGATLKLTKTVNCSTGTYTPFQKKTLTFNATSAYTKAIIRFTYSKASGTVWFDLVSLVK